MRRREFLAAVDAGAKRILVLTEGVVPYLSVEEAASLADDLRELSHVRGWVVDYFSPEATKYRHKQAMDRKMQNAPFKFEPADWHGFFREHGWEAKESRYLMEEGERLGRRMPIPAAIRAVWGFWRLFLSENRRREMRRFAGYVLLQRR